ncbi:hypothetical protein OUZ56_031317 [Daphnia magna]|uniref:Uncharacterized protein n=1 Tax=Daphnia magna TaxID=35525 RepID=A0ABQ9ZTW5_9CRUS|nr:hypothetical protein OUZ56_031317 [Daphnia magna]
MATRNCLVPPVLLASSLRGAPVSSFVNEANLEEEQTNIHPTMTGCRNRVSGYLDGLAGHARLYSRSIAPINRQADAYSRHSLSVDVQLKTGKQPKLASVKTIVDEEETRVTVRYAGFVDNERTVKRRSSVAKPGQARHTP